jgi:cytochrome c oxidase subunit 2
MRAIGWDKTWRVYYGRLRAPHSYYNKGSTMKKLPVLIIAAWFPVLMHAAQASADAQGKYQPCAACHGAMGEGNAALNAPALAGQGAAYLERQLLHFKSGVRGSDPSDTQGAQMKAMAATLADEDIPVVATYLAGLPLPVVTDPQQGDLRNGNNYYQSKCGACHGGKAEGNPGLNTPGLSGLDAAYMKRQYLNFQQGLRGSDPQDRYGKQMKMMSTSLPGDKDLDDVIAFIQSLVD